MATYSVVLPEFLQPKSPIMGLSETEIAQGGHLLEEKHPLPSQRLPLVQSRAPWQTLRPHLAAAPAASDLCSLVSRSETLCGCLRSICGSTEIHRGR